MVTSQGDTKLNIITTRPKNPEYSTGGVDSFKPDIVCTIKKRYMKKIEQFVGLRRGLAKKGRVVFLKRGL